ncbi:hypothetical protein BGX28_003990 [Mortierella sp. GBA30]|nr:hypothetical protein BGX28_003990 [Mortierella sp. GBA30]
MTRARRLQTSNHHKAKSTSLPAATTLRHRRPKTKDGLEKEKEERKHSLDKAIVTGDIEALRRLSVTGPGFVDHAVRRRAWPLLLRTHVPRKETVDGKTYSPASLKTVHKDEEQVRLDVIRSFTHLENDTSKPDSPKSADGKGKEPMILRGAKCALVGPPLFFFSSPESQQAVKRQRQDDLLQVILDVLHRHPKLAYYQGFHDVCTCLIIVLGKQAATLAAESLAMFFFRDCMSSNLEPVLDQLSLMTALLRIEAPDVQEFLDRREELFDVECDNAMVHTFLTKFPKNIDLEKIISHAHELYTTHPPETLQNRAQSWLDDNSCVNTFNKPGTRLYEDEHEKASSTPVDFEPIDHILNQPRVKRTKESSSLSKYPQDALRLYRRNMMAMTAFSAAASVGTVAFLLLNSSVFREWLNNTGFH